MSRHSYDHPNGNDDPLENLKISGFAGRFLEKHELNSTFFKNVCQCFVTSEKQRSHKPPLFKLRTVKLAVSFH